MFKLGARCFFLIFSKIWQKQIKDHWISVVPWHFTIFIITFRLEKMTSLIEDFSIKISVKGRWTIHGIWPSVDRGSGPTFCDNTNPLDPRLLDPILDDLKTRWTVVHQNSEENYFWNHEWTKHGTCAKQLDSMNSEIKYFRKGKAIIFIWFSTEGFLNRCA